MKQKKNNGHREHNGGCQGRGGWWRDGMKIWGYYK